MRGFVVVLALVLCGCSITPANDPIIGCWQRVGDDVALRFAHNGRAAQVPRDGGVIDYVFADMAWRRSGDGYALRYDWPRLQQRTTVKAARVVRGQLLFDQDPAPYERVRNAECGRPLT